MEALNVADDERGPEIAIEERAAIAFAKLPPSQQPKESSELAYWVGQMAGWPGWVHFSPDRREEDQKVHVAIAMRQFAESAHALAKASGLPDESGILWTLLSDTVTEQDAAAWRTYLRQLEPVLPLLANAPTVTNLPQTKKGGRPARDLYAKVLTRVVCAYLIFVEGHSLSGRAPQTQAFPYQAAARLTQEVLKVVGIKPAGELESLVRQVLSEPWTAADAPFDFWRLLPDVARPQIDQK